MVVVSMSTEVFYPVLPGGFAQFFRYGPGLRERGVQLRVHTTLHPEHEGERETRVNGIDIRRHVSPDGLHHQKERVRLIRHALAAMNNDDPAVRHCLQPNCGTWESTALLWRARMAGVPNVFYSTMFPEDPPARLDKRLRYAVRMRAVHSAFSRLVVSSHRIKDAFHRLAKVPERRMPVLPNGVDLDRFSPSDDRGPLRRRLGLPEDAPLVLYSGSAIPRKGIDVLLEAWESVLGEMPEARLVLMGSIGMRPSFRDAGMRAELEEFTDKVERQLAGLSNPDSVMRPGEVDAVEDYYRSADVFAFASRREGLPNAVLEAMATGLPCVVAPFAGIPDDGEEFGRDGREFRRSSHDPQRMGADILDLLTSPDRRQAMGAAARAWMETHQDPEKTLDVLAGVYHDVARSRKRR